MDEAEGLSSWSDECKARFAELQAAWTARAQAQAESDAAEERRRAARDAARALQAQQESDTAELAAREMWLSGYNPARAAKQLEFEAAQRAHRDAVDARRSRERAADDAIDAEYKTWKATTNPSAADRIARRRADVQRKREASAAIDAEIDALRVEEDRVDDELAALRRERDDQAARRRGLEAALVRRRREFEQARQAATHAEAAARRATDALANHRSEDDLIADYYALLRACGPADPAPGGPSIPVPAHTPTADTPWQRRLRLYRAEVLRVGMAPFTPRYVNVDDDEQRLPLALSSTIEASTATGAMQFTQRAPQADVWHEQCVEFLWIQGTRPVVNPAVASNPITQTVALAIADVNEIFAGCCVRFTAHLKVVTLAQLGALANPTSGIFVDDFGAVHAVSMEAFSDTYPRVVRDLQDHADCVGFFVVDTIPELAGFAAIGGRVGVVTMPPVAPGDVHATGDITAHELGHAVGGIEHLENVGGQTVAHRHGDLMWGKGCADYPHRTRGRRYAHVTASNCTKMRAGTRATEEPCDHRHDGM